MHREVYDEISRCGRRDDERRELQGKTDRTIEKLISLDKGEEDDEIADMWARWDREW